MKTLLIIILIILAIFIGYWIYEANTSPSTAIAPTGTTNPPSGGTPGGPFLPALDATVSDGAVTIAYPSVDFAVATKQAQLPGKSYTPSCDSPFDDCLYYANSSTYAGTNFESAGVSITQKTSLATATACLNDQPAGYSDMTPIIATSSDYSTSVFPNVGGGAAGHFTADNAYRLAYNATCYEFTTRIAQSDFENYPSGTILQFTAGEQDSLQNELGTILSSLTITASGEKIMFPQL